MEGVMCVTKKSDGWPRRGGAKGRITINGGTTVSEADQKRMLDSSPVVGESGIMMAERLLQKEEG
jgi:hypothetical protein